MNEFSEIIKAENAEQHALERVRECLDEVDGWQYDVDVLSSKLETARSDLSDATASGADRADWLRICGHETLDGFAAEVERARVERDEAVAGLNAANERLADAERALEEAKERVFELEHCI